MYKVAVGFGATLIPIQRGVVSDTSLVYGKVMGADHASISPPGCVTGGFGRERHREFLG